MTCNLARHLLILYHISKLIAATMEYYNGYNPKDYTTTHVTKKHRGVNYVEVRDFFAGQLTGTHFECNCQRFNTAEAAQTFINETFFNVPDPFVATA